MNVIQVKIWGGGGGGGTDSVNSPFASYGGGASGYAQGYVSVSPGQVLRVVVGGGGGSNSKSLNSAGGFGGDSKDATTAADYGR